MLNVIRVCSLAFCFMFSSITFAAPQTQTVTPAEKAAITQAVNKLSKQANKKLPITAITPTPVPGIMQVTSDMTVFYVTVNGEYLFFGDLLDLSRDKNSISLTENATRALRANELKTLKPQDLITFPATGKKLASVYIFTDIDCPYCHKLQENIKEYTDAGFEIHYLSFPRSGPKTPSFDEAIKVWCAADKVKAYVKAIESKEFPKDTCKNNPVMMEYELGQKFGINGTPTMILDNGIKVGGLVDAKTLVKIYTGKS